MLKNVFNLNCRKTIIIKAYTQYFNWIVRKEKVPSFYKKKIKPTTIKVITEALSSLSKNKYYYSLNKYSWAHSLHWVATVFKISIVKTLFSIDKATEVALPSI